MPFYEIFISLKKTDQSISGRSISVIREYKDGDLDRVWHMLFVKCQEKWGHKLHLFDCVLISKRSPDYLKFIRDQQQKKFNRYDDILSPEYLQNSGSHEAVKNSLYAVKDKDRNQRG
jgi:hypothetical protein